MTVEIREVKRAEAPVAIIEYDNLYKYAVRFRWFGGQLWSDEGEWGRGRGDRKYQMPTVALYQSDRYLDYKSLMERRQDISDWAKDWLLIGGTPYRTHGEPRYVVMTFGLGCNHGVGGGTALMVDHSFNPNIGKARYFPITQREAAIAEATRIAIARGDTKALPIRPSSRFTILIPEAVRCNPAKQHGDGDPFMNELNAMTERVKNPIVAGFGALAILGRELSRKEANA
jgi:hypothetical protein